MEETKTKGYKRFKFILTILLIVFGCLYFASKTGYYEKNISNNTLLTSEAIKAFEKDVADGKPVDITDYINKNNRNYENTYSKIGYTISNTIDKVLNDGTVWFINILKSLFS